MPENISEMAIRLAVVMGSCKIIAEKIRPQTGTANKLREVKIVGKDLLTIIIPHVPSAVAITPVNNKAPVKGHPHVMDCVGVSSNA